MRLLRTVMLSTLALAACGGVSAATPEQMNMSKEGLDKVLNELKKLVDQGQIPGAAFVVHR